MKILELLTRSKEAKEEAEARRTARALARGQEALIDKLEAKRDDLQAKIDKLLDVKIGSINEATWNSDYHDANIELIMMEKEIESAVQTRKELFTKSRVEKTK